MPMISIHIFARGTTGIMRPLGSASPAAVLPSRGGNLPPTARQVCESGVAVSPLAQFTRLGALFFGHSKSGDAGCERAGAEVTAR